MRRALRAKDFRAKYSFVAQPNPPHFASAVDGDRDAFDAYVDVAAPVPDPWG